ncbi:MAG: F0F1 ATP synthase subunit B [Patescibacteria group bacterium]|nr:F0F1 ATP synthase subunit B [Patescibacteria group bacterium]
MSALFATFGINVPLLTMQAVNFGVAMLVLWYFVYRPLIKVIEERKQKIAKGVEDANAAADARAKTEGERSGILSAAEKEAENVVAKAVDEGKAERATIVKQAQERSDAILEDARAEAEEARRKALAASEKDIARLATLAAEKILKES